MNGQLVLQDSQQITEEAAQAVRRLKIGGRVLLELPTFIYFCRTTHELEVLARSDKLDTAPPAIFLRFADLFDLSSKLKLGRFARSFDLRAIPKLVDPEPELFLDKNNTPRLRVWLETLRRLASVPIVREVEASLSALNKENYNDSVLEMSGRKWFWQLVDACLQAQAKVDVDLATPFTPIIDGKNTDIISLAVSVNRVVARTFAQSPLKPYGPSHYFALARSALHTSSFRTALEDFLFLDDTNEAQSEHNPHVLFLKILGLQQLTHDEVLGLKDLIRTLNSARRLNKLAVFLLDAGEAGFPLLASGLDGYSENAEIQQSDFDARQDCHEDRLKYLWMGDSESVLGLVSFDSAVRLFERNGYAYPCGYRCCKYKQGVDPRQVDQNTWNEDCLTHLVNTRTALLKFYRDELRAGNRRAIPKLLVRSLGAVRYLNWVERSCE
jgi:hypothetical protein